MIFHFPLCKLPCRYALIFGERPFFDVEETISCTLRPPFEVGADCEDLLLWILHPDPSQRATAKEVLEHRWCQQRPDRVKKGSGCDGGDGVFSADSSGVFEDRVVSRGGGDEGAERVIATPPSILSDRSRSASVPRT